MNQRNVLLLGVVVVLAGLWWFAYGAPAAEYFRRENADRRAVQPAELVTTPDASNPAPPLLIVSSAIVLSTVQTLFSGFQTECRLVGIGSDRPTLSRVGFSAIDRGSRNQAAALLDSLELVRLTNAMDSVVAAIPRVRELPGFLDINTHVGEITIEVGISPARVRPTIVLDGEYFSLDDEAKLRELRQLVAGSWADCRTKTGPAAR